MRVFTVLAVAAALTGCAALPGDGPAAINITSQDIESEQSVADYTVIKIDSSNIETIKRYRPLAFANQFRGVGNGGSSTLLGVGDTLSVGIWEASPDGLFSDKDGGASTIPAVIDESGSIFIPYAGRIRAAGLSVEGLRQSIQQKLVGKAVEPQVLVTLNQKLSSTAVVVGDVGKPGVYPLPVRNTRLLDLVATAGGARQATFETVVTLKRGNRSGTTRLEHLIDYPENNVVISPNDNILLSHRPRTFSAFGAVKANQLVPFRTKSVTLAEALATVGGLNDNKADATGVFLFRFEDSDLVRSVRPEVASKIAAHTQVPAVYRLNMRDPSGFFLARHFEMRDKDILFVSNHPTAEFGKFLQIIAPLISNYAVVSSVTD
ncbi:polysaccharide export outer membrane protein [Roseibium hamelinense]|uniref:Polysaccharide export outer membrane protein n=1 Tax=Roseibium hamelinense TaxID=150831 RepID=A0A562T7J1_9HYPH|nr:polysaccharide biosynthesis/export family protein [Roseibium hamelinense]MTI42989.1 polysaccharide export protein [Roseibium hamelinense]TWI89599.1 polysaccharide export outer membrane protein [Roseibium hamelinense]